MIKKTQVAILVVSSAMGSVNAFAQTPPSSPCDPYAASYTATEQTTCQQLQAARDAKVQTIMNTFFTLQQQQVSAFLSALPPPPPPPANPPSGGGSSSAAPPSPPPSSGTNAQQPPSSSQQQQPQQQRQQTPQFHVN